MSPLDRMRALIRLPTMSSADMETEAPDPYRSLLDLLPALYPALFRRAAVEQIEQSLMLTLPGMSAGGAIWGFVGHYDVVPPGQQEWRHDPFGAEVIAGEVWGRGVIDDKGRLAALLDALDALCAEGWQPCGRIVLFIDHDEETAGSGARALAQRVVAEDIRFDALFDEGEGILQDVFPGIDRPTAMIGIAEKGFANAVLTVREDAGHAAVPPPFAATVRLARAVVRLNAASPAPQISDPLVPVLRTLREHSGDPVFGEQLDRALAGDPGAALVLAEIPDLAPLLQTTQAVTQLSGSPTANALAAIASATVNLRIVPGDSVAATHDRLAASIDDPDVRIDMELCCEPSSVSPSSGDVWQALSGALAESHPAAVAVPFVLPGATDSRHLAAHAAAIYRFMPLLLEPAQRAGLHGPDERITVGEWYRSIDFYRALLQRLGAFRR